MITKALNDIDMNQLDKSTVIGEFSGRDSVAAIMKAYEFDDVTHILPVATFAGTEYGDFDVIYENYEKLIEEVSKRYGDKKVLYPLVEYNDEKLWHLLNGRFTTLLIEKFGFYNPCIGCHLYFHLTKLKFAKGLSKRIISGERSSHDGRVKVNQLDETLSSYRNVLTRLGYELLMPIQYLESGEEIVSLIGWHWEEGKAHPKCVLSGNYRDVFGKAVYDEKALSEFLLEYIEGIGYLAGRYVLGEISYSDLDNAIKEIL
jgi:hypothetical protein